MFSRVRAGPLLVPEGLYGVEPGGAGGRVETGDDADRHADPEGQDNAVEGDDGRHARECGDDPGDGDADNEQYKNQGDIE